MAELSQFALETLHDRYLQDGDTSVAQAFARASSAFASDIKHAERMYKYTYVYIMRIYYSDKHIARPVCVCVCIYTVVTST